MIKSKYNKKKGFTLLELILVLSIGMLISLISFQEMMKKQEGIQSSAMGQQIKRIGKATNIYITNKYNVLSSLSDSTGITGDMGPRTCYSSSETCVITIQTLIEEGLLPKTYNASTRYNQGYSITLKRSGTAPYYKINGVVLSQTPLKIGPNIRYDMLGKSMQEAGIDSGMIRTSATKLDGYEGLWSYDSTQFSNINQKGLLGYIVGFDADSFAVFLRRDGTLPMTGDLNMGAQNINNAKNINAAGTGNFGGDLKSNQNIQAGGNITSNQDILAGGEITSTKNITAHNGYGDAIIIGGDSSTNDYEIKMMKEKPLSLHFSSNRTDLTILNVTGGVSVNGNSQFTGLLNASGNITSNAIVSGQYLEPSVISIVGNYCPKNGLISRDNIGNILSCKSGLWTISSTNIPAGSPIPWPTTVAPSGWLICNGQAFNKATYPNLAIAYPSGFLPDLRGVFIRGWDNGRGLDAGRGLLTYQADQSNMTLNTGGRLEGHHNGMEHNYRNGNEIRPKNVSFNYIVKAE